MKYTVPFIQQFNFLYLDVAPSGGTDNVRIPIFKLASGKIGLHIWILSGMHYYVTSNGKA